MCALNVTGTKLPHAGDAEAGAFFEDSSVLSRSLLRILVFKSGSHLSLFFPALGNLVPKIGKVAINSHVEMRIPAIFGRASLHVSQYRSLFHSQDKAIRFMLMPFEDSR